ncbi:anti-sigma regulatory factor (Ser/Thr protein kinase) [Kitasatospora acidiphila]
MVRPVTKVCHSPVDSQPQIIGGLRRQLRELAHLFGALDGPRIADMEVGLTELLTNVAEHVPDRRAVVTVDFLGSGGIVVRVRDSSDQSPAAGELSQDDDWLNLAEGGRGLALVKATATSMNWRRIPGGKIVEAAYLPLPAARHH